MKGEFEKRIKTLDSDYEKLTSFEIAHIEKTGEYPNFSAVRWIKRDRVLEMIDEARKEFPLLSKELEEKYPETWADELNSLRLQWFKKYFGTKEVSE